MQVVADHVEHIATVTGKEQYVSCFLSLLPSTDYLFISVGLGSDFDGIDSGPEGLEDVSKYPELVRYHISFLPFGRN